MTKVKLGQSTTNSLMMFASVRIVIFLSIYNEKAVSSEFSFQEKLEIEYIILVCSQWFTTRHRRSNLTKTMSDLNKETVNRPYIEKGQVYQYIALRNLNPLSK